jgi:peptide/nickel transport system substrate-binding protein
VHTQSIAAPSGVQPDVRSVFPVAAALFASGLRSEEQSMNGDKRGRKRPSRISRRSLLKQAGAASVAGVALSQVAPGSIASAQNATPIAGGSLTWAVETLTDTLPFGAIGQPVTHTMTYDSLIEWDSNLLPVPGLATSYEVIDDVTYIFHLREGVTFSDGRPLTADDVVYSIDVIHRNPPPPGQSFSFYPKIESVTAIDPLTVEFKLRETDPSLTGFLTWTRYSNIMPVGMHEEINVLAEAIGTGPFTLTEFETNSYATLVRNESYWDQGKPLLDEVSFAYLPDPQARVAALRSGEIDGAAFPADIAFTLQEDSELTVLSGLQANHREIQMVIKDPTKPWANKQVRQAVQHAINRQDIIDKVYAGEAEYSGNVPTGYGEWPLPLEELRNNYLKYDVELAKQLMAEGGYPDGFSVTLQAINWPDITSCALVAAEHLAEIGIDVTVEPLEFPVFAANNGEGNFDWQLTQRGFRGDISGYVNEFSPNAAIFANWFEGGWENQELFDLIAAGLQTSDEAERRQIYTDVQVILAEEAVHVTLVQANVFWAVANRLQGVTVPFHGDVGMVLKNVWVQD